MQPLQQNLSPRSRTVQGQTAGALKVGDQSASAPSSTKAASVASDKTPATAKPLATAAADSIPEAKPSPPLPTGSVRATPHTPPASAETDWDVELVQDMVNRISRWFDQAGRKLPWRQANCSPWGVLVSEIMAQQTPIARVEPAWTAWMDRWPSPQALAQAPTAELIRMWGRLGYPRRALRMQECAISIVNEHGGQVPNTYDALVALPGIGDYTAAAVLSFAYGQRATVVDTNVRRVLSRILNGHALPQPSLTADEKALAARVVPIDAGPAARWAVASMELGALMCTARKPACLTDPVGAGGCPVADLCAWRAAGYPPDQQAHRRRGQAWQGTDRQTRGQIMAILRHAEHAVSVNDISLQLSHSQPGQMQRCLNSLIEDGLIEQVEQQPHHDSVHAVALPNIDADLGSPLAEVEYRLPA